ncbi:glycoside hydrolase superfamily [Jimgerdemannia flammicorona]|uniref:beta-glucosidase n=1 Tax=Jimgerdemannia flammicorona TaxID=994334 RepID=A0A433QJ68_9FUNG|nr:glycoside hydrolase superfamily [Jimgerdemannia flammicorona]
MRISTAVLICALSTLAVAGPVEYHQSKFDTPTDKLDHDVQKLLDSLSLQEKIGQLSQLNINTISIDSWSMNGLNKTAVEYYAETWGIGSFLNQAQDNTTWLLDSRGYAKLVNEINEIYLNKTKHKIPIIYGLDSVRGAHYIKDATIFPAGIAQGATFNPSIVEEANKITAFESSTANVKWSFSPILDISFNKLWPRLYENFGEDPYLTSVLGAAAVIGLQGKFKTDDTKIAASLKHYIGYGGTRTGQDKDNAWVPINYLLDYQVPAYRAAIAAGAATVMTSYSAVNGQPVSSSKYLMDTLLRKELGFKGMVVSDWQEGYYIQQHHYAVKDLYNAVIAEINTGTDMSMTPTDTE